MSWERIGYALLCVLVPGAWGLAVYWVSTRIERRLFSQSAPDSDAEAKTLPLEYHI